MSARGGTREKGRRVCFSGYGSWGVLGISSGMSAARWYWILDTLTYLPLLPEGAGVDQRDSVALTHIPEVMAHAVLIGARGVPQALVKDGQDAGHGSKVL